MADLAPYAFPDGDTRGRRHPEPPHPFRTPFQRDRERIVHSSAFRRMTGKTQVLVASVNDHHRTRLTHTLEVTQVARTAARRLRLNEDLTEAIALAHDIGHPPFGHAGEDALNECLRAVGGFNHNLYGLRRVDELEERYPEFPGLNLTFELRESFVSHSRHFDAPEAAEFFNDFRSPASTSEVDGSPTSLSREGEAPAEPNPHGSAGASPFRSLPNPHGSAGASPSRTRTGVALSQPPLEAQVVDTVDSIAYDVHDLDDALSLGFLATDDLQGVELWQQACARVRGRYANLDPRTFRTAVIRELLAWLVTDLLDETARQIEARKVATAADVRLCGAPLVSFTADVRRMKSALETFLRAHVYRHHKVLRMTAGGKRILKALFDEYLRGPELLPTRHYERWAGAEPAAPLPPNRRREPHLARVVGDYLAGMTDRYAQQEHRRLFSPMGEV